MKRENQVGYSKANEELVNKFWQNLKDEHVKRRGIHADILLHPGLRWNK